MKLIAWALFTVAGILMFTPCHAQDAGRSESMDSYSLEDKWDQSVEEIERAWNQGERAWLSAPWQCVSSWKKKDAAFPSNTFTGAQRYETGRKTIPAPGSGLPWKPLKMRGFALKKNGRIIRNRERPNIRARRRMLL